MPPNLPTELIDKILGDLKDDHHSLRACSLVSHSWLPSAHRLLFFSVHVDLHRNCGSLEPFIKLISSSNAISRGIRRLWIQGYQLHRKMSTE